ncbi:MAG: 3-phosphoshikimate 1-carboxyvinyltransferase [Clostridia bacterium]|nr:3-phosphoshikimate 1-carboxyvinyltransferase [Clostridia bacterium]
MNIRIEKGLAGGTIKAPPSKSYAHRHLIAGALSNGTSMVCGIIDSVDMRATLSCIRALGVKYEKKGEDVSVFGGKYEPEAERIFNCYESGSTLRFFIPIALALGEEATFVGTQRLLSRGLGVYEEIFEKQGIEFTCEKEQIKIKGSLKADTFYVRGDISSQFITGLLFALPLLENDSKIIITTELESKAYVDITLDVLKSFGIEISRKDNELYIGGGQKYIAKNVVVEGDASNSAFLDVFNFLGGDVSVLGINDNTIQADYIYKKYFYDISNSTPKIDLSNCPDLAPITFALAGAKNGAHFVGTRRLKIKESDRATAMATELRKFGIDTEIYENEVIIKNSNLHTPEETLNGHNDHRIVMSLAVLCTLFGGTISGCEAVNKSYPNFFEDIKKLGIKWEEVADENN